MFTLPTGVYSFKYKQAQESLGATNSIRHCRGVYYSKNARKVQIYDIEFEYSRKV